MTDDDWLPEPILLSEHGGQWSKYIDAVFAVFYRDFIASSPRYQGLRVRCRRDPAAHGKEAGFWHCVSEGAVEDQRLPGLRRCERIAWVRRVIEHADAPGVDVWVESRGSEQRHHSWWREAYLVVLGERRRYYQLITAYCTDRAHAKENLRRRRDRARND